MSEKSYRFRGWHGWVLRAGYITALLAFAATCFYFYQKQIQQNADTNHIRTISNAVGQLDESLRELRNKAARVAESYAGVDDSVFLREMALSLPFKQRKQWLAQQPSDPDIISSQTALSYHLGNAEFEFNLLLDAWSMSGTEISTAVFENAKFVTIDDPFKNHIDLLNRSRIDNARSKQDIFWASRELLENYESLVAPTNLHMQQQLRLLLEDQAAKKGTLLQQFLLFAMGCVAAIACFIFVPVDVFLNRTLKRLSVAQQKAEAAVKRAENADRAKSEFLANMSHEIRTPMNGVMGMAELLAKTQLDARQKSFTDIIVKSGAALLTIINDILDFSKIDAGRLELDPAPFKIAEAVEDVATLVSSRVSEKDLELIVRVDPELPDYVVADVGRLRQIVTNLMGNAVKFTETGHIYVNVFKVEQPANVYDGDDNVRIRFEIEDTGIGIPADQAASIFEKFSQVEGSATRRHEGTGLGLAISSSLVELMGGEMGVESEVGEGSTFWFEITVPVHGEIGFQKRVPIDVSGARVLVVDDNMVNRAILSEQLESWRFEHAAVNNGTEALMFMRMAAARGMAIDCVIMDYHMPGMNGGEVVIAMRSEPILRDLPVIMLTSVEETADGRTFSSLGIQAHLTKPTRSSMLLANLVEVITDARARSENCDDTSIGISIARRIAHNAENNASGEYAPTMEPAPKPSLAEVTANTSKLDTVVSATDNGKNSAPDVGSGPEITTKQAIRKEHLDVLVCEDNEVNQIVVGQILEGGRYTYEIAPNGKLGVELFEKYRPSIVLMDVSMPEMNGFEATRAIRELENGQAVQTPIIGVTAHAIKGDRERCLEAGMDDYVSKPVSPEILLEKIETWLYPAGDAKSAGE